MSLFKADGERRFHRHPLNIMGRRNKAKTKRLKTSLAKKGWVCQGARAGIWTMLFDHTDEHGTNELEGLISGGSVCLGFWPVYVLQTLPTNNRC